MLARKYWAASITVERLTDAVKRRMTTRDNPGFCLICGEEAGGCAPDARDYPCGVCGAEQVFGADELLLMMPERYLPPSGEFPPVE